jgi:hypothetical protein
VSRAVSAPRLQLPPAKIGKSQSRILPLSARAAPPNFSELYKFNLIVYELEEMDDLVIIIADDEDEPPLKRHKVEAISHINSLIETTKAVQADVEWSLEHLIKTSRKLERRRKYRPCGED